MDENNNPNVQEEQPQQPYYPPQGVNMQPAPAPKKAKIGLSITGFILGLFALVSSFSFLTYPVLIQLETDALKGKHGGNVIVDTSIADAIMRVSGYMAIIVAIASICLSVAGIIVTAVKKGDKKGIIFGAIGAAAALIGLLIIVANISTLSGAK